MADTSSFEDFRAALRPLLEHLEERLGFSRWTLARKADDDYVVIAAYNHGLHSDGGEVYRWSESLCARMSLGLAPRFAPDIADLPVYADAPFAQANDVRAYLGIPLFDANGLLIGSLSGMHPTPVSEDLAADLPFIESIARVVGANMAANLRFAEQERLAEQALVEASTDPLTGLANRRTWEWVLKAEENRCQRFGHTASIVCLDLDELKVVNDTLGHDAGDELLTRAARAISASVRAPDVVARLGGDEFAVLAVETGSDAVDALAIRINEALRERGVSASVGVATLGGQGLRAVWAEADAAMYDMKRRQRTVRIIHEPSSP